MGFFPVVLFFAITWGLGFSLTRLVKESESFLERNIMRVGFGLCAFVLLGVILNTIRVPLDYRIILALSLAVPVYWLIFRRKGAKLPSPKLKSSDINILIVLLIVGASLFMYASGTFKYPYLEDDDPWGHASAVKYVSMEKTAFDSPYFDFQYMDPYPPGYDMVLGILNQVSTSVSWTIKFFTALMISLSLAFFYFFSKEFMASRNKALFATFVLAAVPAYLSHFIWAPALAMVVFCPTMYVLEMINTDKRWKFIAAVGVASILLAHPTHAVVLLSLIAIYIVAKIVYNFVSERKEWFKRSSQYVQSAIFGVALSLFWWGLKWRGMAGNLNEGFNIPSAIASSPSHGIFSKLGRIITALFNPASGTATRAYTFQDFFIAKSSNMINNPIGFGVVVSLLALVGVAAILWKLFARFRSLQQKERFYLSVLLLWLVFTFLAVNSDTFHLPIGLFAFRLWMILAIPVAMVAAEGLFALFNGIGQLKPDSATATAVKLLAIAVIVVAVFLTSAKQKYDVNTACWPAGAFWSGNLVVEPSSGCPVQSELLAYNWLRTLPPNTNVFTFTNPDQVIGFDQFACGWCKADYDMKKQFYNVTPPELHDFMLGNNYGYFIIGGIETRRYGFNETVKLINSVASSGLFSVAHQEEAAIVFRAT